VPYLYLICTILLESGGIALLNKADGLAHPKFLVGGLVLLNLGMVAFAQALRTLDMTIANTTWAGSSILLVAILGFVWFGERYSPVQYSLIGLVLVGLVGLNLSGISR